MCQKKRIPMRKPVLFFAVFLLSVVSLYGDPYENIAVVHGGPNISGGAINVAERIAANEFYKTHPDIYDFIIVYTTFTPVMNMQQGIMLQSAAEGIGRDPSFWSPHGTPTDWGSEGRLLGGARMCNIDQYPWNPDDPMPFPLRGLSSIELLAHEMGHFWLSAMNYKKEGASEGSGGLRGCEGATETERCSPNQHWNSDFSSGPSVMYGHHIVDNEDGTFTYYYDTPRKFGQLDQYVMGLRAPEEVDPMFYLCRSQPCHEGNPSLPGSKTSSPSTVSFEKIEVTMDDIIREMGPRKPSHEEAKKHFNIAFILLNEPGFWPFPEQFAKLDAIRVRYEEWWYWATDGRSTICTRLDGNCDVEEEAPDDDMNDDDQEYPDEWHVEPDDGHTEQPDMDKSEPDDIEKEEEIIPDDDTAAGEKTDDIWDSFDDETGCSCSFISF